ncbi:MAG: fluoride efflux transporter FluC [Angustibacter sp.]
MIWLLVLAGGALGAGTRYVIDRTVRRHRGMASTSGILLVNTLGALALGALSGSSAQVQALWGVGFCGALTTFSTVTVQVVQRLAVHPRAAGRQLFTHLGLPFLAATLGLLLAP